jgi:hypothetical protein
VQLEDITVQCKASDEWWDNDSQWTVCVFKNVTFTQDTKLNIERIGFPKWSDEDFDGISFESSSISLVHPDILRKFPNINRILFYSWNDWNGLNNQDSLENCMTIEHLKLTSKDLTGISSKTFADCRNLETLLIRSDSLANLPDGLFKHQQNLRDLKLIGENVKLRMNSFEGLQNLSILEL